MIVALQSFFALNVLVIGVVCVMDKHGDFVNRENTRKVIELTCVYFTCICVSTCDFLVACEYLNCSIQVFYPKWSRALLVSQIAILTIFEVYLTVMYAFIMNFALTTQFNPAQLFELLFREHEWVFPQYLLSMLGWACSFVAALYFFCFLFFGVALYLIQRLVKRDPNAKLSIKIIIMHVLMNMITGTALFIVLWKLFDYVSPQGNCAEHIQDYLQNPRVISVYEFMLFFAQMTIYYLCYLYTTVSQQI